MAAVKGQWKYHDVKIIEVEGKGPDGKPNKTYNVEPRGEQAARPDYDDSQWESIAPETLKKGRSTGLVCFCWYRIKITIPPEAAGKAVFFRTTVDDYGEVWVDGKLPRTVGQDRRGDRRRVQRPQPRRAQGRPARQGLPDRGLRHQRADLRGADQLDLPRGYLPRHRRQEMIPASFTRRGFLPDEDPLRAFPRDSELSVFDELGRDLPSLLQESSFRGLGAGAPYPGASRGRDPVADAAAVLRAAGVPGVGLRQPGRAGAGDAPAAEYRETHLEFARRYIAAHVRDPRGTGGTPYLEWLSQLVDETRRI